MRNRAVLVCAGALAALVVAVGCGGGDSGTGQPDGDGASATTSARVETTGQQHNDADVTFAQHMIPHHQQAVEMSDIVLAKQDIEPRVADLAKQIKAAQGPEITQMQSWLDGWGIPTRPSMSPGMGGMPGHDNMPDNQSMPGSSGDMMGMLSTQQMTDLENAKGVEAGKLFLSGMIAHHEGAIAMAQNEIADGKFAPTVELAHAIVQTQQQEIDTMKGILETL